MKTEIKVSVLMLTYNQERYIDEAIRSVMLQQTSFSFELIIGNDASTDKTADVCRMWQERYPQQIVLLDREQNLGLQQNFIQTYAHCRGTHVAICEGDDFWTNKHKLQKQADFLDAHSDYSACFHRVVNYFEDNGTKSLSNGGQKKHTDICDLAHHNYISNVSAVFRRNLFGALPEWFARVSTYDYAMHLLNAQYGKIYYMSKPMAVYRQHRAAIWSEAGMDKKLNIALQVRELLLEYFKEHNSVYPILRNSYREIALNLIRYYHSIANEAMVDDTRKRILRYYPEWTANTIKEMEKETQPGFQQKLRQSATLLLKHTRGFVSRFIPLPRV